MNEKYIKGLADIVRELNADLSKLTLSELRRLESHFNGTSPGQVTARTLIQLYAEPVLLKRYKAVRSDDPAKYDLELTCTDCNEAICDIEDDDTMDILLSMMQGHDKEKHR